MKITDVLKETYSALTGNKVRTGLTMLGIIIGIGSVIAMTAIGQGAQNSISSSIQSIGSNLVIVMPGAQRSFGGPSGGRGNALSLTIEDANAIASVLVIYKQLSVKLVLENKLSQLVQTPTPTLSAQNPRIKLLVI